MLFFTHYLFWHFLVKLHGSLRIRLFVNVYFSLIALKLSHHCRGKLDDLVKNGRGNCK